MTTDVLIVGAGGAGMYAATAAARAGASVLLLDKSLIGRGGATVMAQMTVAAAIGSQEPDHWSRHFADTVEAGRGIANQDLALALCRDAPERILEMDAWGVGWTREGGRIRQVTAPGHSRRRCVYVDFLSTGPAVARTLQRQVYRERRVSRMSNVVIADLVTGGEGCAGAVGIDLARGSVLRFHAGAVILAAGGLTRLYLRNSASINMTGDAHALALRAGADVVDMEFVQFFPIAHLAPRLVGMDPIMWDPFRYKLGGRLLNGRMEEFLHLYGAEDGGQYVATRDVAAYAIHREVEAGRGSPHGGVYLDFRHVPEPQLRSAFGSVVDRLVKNGIDLTRAPVEVAPMAHYHMGGIRCNASMETSVPRLYAAGEAVGGTHGANRLSGNGITEALVFGHRAGRYAAERVRATGLPTWDEGAAARAEHMLREAQAERAAGRQASVGEVMHELQGIMQRQVGPVRDEEGLGRAAERIRELRRDVLPLLTVRSVQPFNQNFQHWLDLRNMLETAEAVAVAARERRESRGAHFRSDFPTSAAEFEVNLVLNRRGDHLAVMPATVVAAEGGGAP